MPSGTLITDKHDNNGLTRLLSLIYWLASLAPCCTSADGTGAPQRIVLCKQLSRALSRAAHPRARGVSLVAPRWRTPAAKP